MRRSKVIKSVLENAIQVGLADGNGRLKNMLQSVEPVSGELPLTHATDGFRLRQIIADGALRPTHCKVLNEPLLYMFYGRPAYRPNGSLAEIPSLSSYAPTCLILPPKSVVIKRVLPFDSGAFRRGAMDEYKHHEMRLEDFLLEPDLVSPRKFIKFLYGNIENYFHNKPLPEPDFPASLFEAEALHSLARSESNQGLDERATTIELHTADSFVLADGISAVILPENLLSDTAICEPLKATGAALIPYDYIRQSRPSEYAGLFYDRIKSHYRNKAWL